MQQRAEEKLERARAKASLSGTPGEGGGGKGRTSDRTGRAAVAIVNAERQLEKVMRWIHVFETVDNIYPEDSNEGFVAGLIYGNGMSQQDVCRFTGCTRTTVRRRLDRYIFRCALIAAADGLIDRKEMLMRADPERGDR